MPASYSERIHLQLTDPQKEAAIIDCLFERYQSMRKNVGQAPAPADGNLFRRFLTQSFEQVTGKYGCKQVQFEFDASNNKISISAKPVEEAP